MFAPVSGAHFNPLASALARFEGSITTTELVVLVAVQCTGALAGVALTHAMFDLVPWAPSLKQRTGFGQWLAEGVATFGLLLTIIGARRYDTVVLSAAVAAYIGGAYWFTASTSFANPVVTLARAFTPTFSGIAPAHMAGFIIAQCIGAAAGVALSALLGLRWNRKKGPAFWPTPRVLHSISYQGSDFLFKPRDLSRAPSSRSVNTYAFKKYRRKQ